MTLCKSLKSQEVFFISDLHINHRNVLMFKDELGRSLRNFPNLTEMHNYLITKWNSRVTPDDKVIVLGDVALNTQSSEEVAELHRVLSNLYGTKILVAGNHDNSPDKLAIYNLYFKAIIGCYEYKRAVCTHIPVHPTQLEHRWKYNIHGHLHCFTVPKLGSSGPTEPDLSYINVGCELLDFTPKTYRELIPYADTKET